MGKLLAVLRGAVVVGYPLLTYVGLTRFSARTVGLLLLVLMAPGLIQTARRAPSGQLRSVLPVPLAILGLTGASAVLDDRRFVLALPVLINLALLHIFASSLGRVPMAERFARLQDGELSSVKIQYCRTVTLVWSAFFAFNAFVSAVVALFASLSSWVLYTGVIAYVLVGVLATAEYAVRKYRFREYGDRLQDRLLARLFPPDAKSEKRARSEECAS